VPTADQGGPLKAAVSDCYRPAVEYDLPPALDQLVTALRAEGFDLIAERAYFGDQLLELANPGRETAGPVRLAQDHGLWSVQIEVGGKWRDPYQILLAIDGRKYATRASSHEERLRFTLEALQRMPPRSELKPVLDRLEEFGREYWRPFRAQEL
jgi:hypothetical protein